MQLEMFSFRFGVSECLSDVIPFKIWLVFVVLMEIYLFKNICPPELKHTHNILNYVWYTQEIKTMKTHTTWANRSKVQINQNVDKVSHCSTTGLEWVHFSALHIVCILQSLCDFVGVMAGSLRRQQVSWFSTLHCGCFFMFLYEETLKMKRSGCSSAETEHQTG